MKCANKRKIQTLLLIVVLLPLLIVRCSPEKRFKTLSFFFDGVPDPNNKIDSSLVVSDTMVQTVKKTEPEFFYHKPYEEDKCENCHVKGFSNALLQPQPELCYSCHEDFTLKYKIMHAPASTGYCTTCHNHHMAKYKKLLNYTGQEVCLNCHEKKQVFQNKMHEKIGDENCTVCHSPHGGDNQGMLIEGSCNKCHEDFSKKYNFLHGPVAQGSCTGCHDSHSSKNQKLLSRDSQQICLYCHDAEQVYKNEAHKKVKKTNCTECHNPHGGEDRFLLIKSIAPNKENK